MTALRRLLLRLWNVVSARAADRPRDGPQRAPALVVRIQPRLARADGVEVRGDPHRIDVSSHPRDDGEVSPALRKLSRGERRRHPRGHLTLEKLELGARARDWRPHRARRAARRHPEVRGRARHVARAGRRRDWDSLRGHAAAAGGAVIGLAASLVLLILSFLASYLPRVVPPASILWRHCARSDPRASARLSPSASSSTGR